MIALRNINKRFGKLQVLNNISVTFSGATSVALIGPNGSGKTTLIKSILGMVIPDQGILEVDGNAIINQVEYRNDIGYMPQISRFPENMTIGQLFDMMLDLRRNTISTLDWQLFDSFGLHLLKSKKLKTLSGGTRQKVSASLAFLFSPRILILDEPTAGLDPVAVEILKEKIRKVRSQRRLILITSHILSDLDEIISDIVYMHEGRIVFHKSFEELLAETGEMRLSKAIAQVMLQHGHVPNLLPSSGRRA